MSFILDALRKSDARRRMGQSPDLASAPPASRSSGRRSRALSLFGVLAVVAVLAAGAWVGRELWLPSGSETVATVIDADRDGEARMDGSELLDGERRDAMARALLPDEPREVVISDPAEIEGAVERRLARDRAVPGPPLAANPERVEPAPAPESGRWVSVDPAEQARIQRILEEAEQRRQREAAGLAPEFDPGLSEAGQVDQRRRAAGEPRWTPEAAEYVRKWELPLSVRRNMPELKLTIHVYSPDPEARFVLVNGERYIIGDMLGDDARLVDIRREGAIVDFRDHRFLLEP